MPDPCRVALTPGALADLDRLDSFLRPKNPPAADRMLATLTGHSNGWVLIPCPALRCPILA